MGDAYVDDQGNSYDWYLDAEWILDDGDCVRVVPENIECPSNWEYDDSTHCCVQYYRPADRLITPECDYSACPSPIFESQPLLMNYNATNDTCTLTLSESFEECQTFNYNLGYCGGDRDGGGACQPPPSGCGSGKVWNQQDCCCMSLNAAGCGP